jgi:hypothetical protein
VTSCRLAFQRACTAVDYTFAEWLGPRELSKQMTHTGLLPDGYLRITRPTADGSKTAALFVEVERTGKSEPLLAEKIALYRDYYYGGSYERTFGSKALRVLVLVGNDYGLTPERQMSRYLSICNRLAVTIFRFVPLATFLAEKPDHLLGAPIWRQPGEENLRGLFPGGSSE